MSVSKAWDWNEEKNQIWLDPSEESYFISARWKKQGYKKILDFGCGLGRHSVFFSRQGFIVSAFDLSTDGVNHLRDWAKKDALEIDIQVADMLSLPYADESFDCLFAYHVISHTDTNGMKKIMSEIKRVVKPQGEIYITLCSKESWSFTEAGYPKIDENTIKKTEPPEKDVPHYYSNLDDIVILFSEFDFELYRIRHTDDCYYDGQKRSSSKHYFILATKKNNK